MFLIVVGVSPKFTLIGLTLASALLAKQFLKRKKGGKGCDSRPFNFYIEKETTKVKRIFGHVFHESI